MEKWLFWTKIGVSTATSTQRGLVSISARQMSLGHVAIFVEGGYFRNTFAYVVTPAVSACQTSRKSLYALNSHGSRFAMRGGFGPVHFNDGSLIWFWILKHVSSDCTMQPCRNRMSWGMRMDWSNSRMQKGWQCDERQRYLPRCLCWKAPRRFWGLFRKIYRDVLALRIWIGVWKENLRLLLISSWGYLALLFVYG